MKIVKAFRIVLFCSILCAGLIYCDRVIAYKHTDFFNAKFYDETENTIDVLYLGPSLVGNGVNPLYIWDKFGYTGYNLATGGQNIEASYYLLKAALKKQNPQVVFFEVNALKKDTVRNEIDDLKVYDQIDHFTRFEMLADKWKRNQKIEVNDILQYMRLLHYHDRWSELSVSDFKNTEGIGQWKGYGIMTSSIELHEIPYTEDAGDCFLSEEQIMYLDKISDLCKEENAELILMATPTHSWRKGLHDLVNGYARENNIQFIDFLEFYKELGISEKDCFFDYHDVNGGVSHLNYRGSSLLSEYLGNYLQNNYEIEDKRGNIEYSSWDEKASKLKRQYSQTMISKITDFNEWLELIAGPEYYVFFAQNNLSESKISDSAKKILDKALGAGDWDVEECNFVMVMNGEQVLFNERSENVLNFKREIDEQTFQINSIMTENGLTNVMYHNELNYIYNYTENMSFMVYDAEMKKIVDWGLVDINSEECTMYR